MSYVKYNTECLTGHRKFIINHNKMYRHIKCIRYRRHQRMAEEVVAYVFHTARLRTQNAWHSG